MRSALSVARIALPAAVALTVPLVAIPAAHAAETPVITQITTENNAGGFTPYIPLYTSVAVSVTDESPSDTSAYRLDIVGEGYQRSYDRFAVAGEPGELMVYVDAYDLPVGTPLDFTVTELQDGQPASTSPAAPYTFTYVDHPRRLLTSSTEVDGRVSYKAGRTARLRLRGEWEAGTRISTQVWVSRRKRFTEADWNRNVNKGAALVEAYNRRRPVLSFDIPRRLRGQYVWVSMLGWKPGEGGWVFEIDREYVR